MDTAAPPARRRATAKKTTTAGSAPDGAAARLKRLRGELTRRGLDGFLVPRADAHQGEYVAAEAERLAWLTGFTGSAGLAVVLKRRAALFTDGRYTLQVKDQVDASLYELCHLTLEPATDWIARNLPRGGKLGYDPWLVTPAQAQRYTDTCRKRGGLFTAVDDNPLDAVWSDRPGPPLTPVRAHPKKFAGQAARDKRDGIARALTDQGQAAQVLSAPDSIAWLLNIRGADVPRTPVTLAFAVIHKDASVDLFIDGRKLSAALRRHLGDAVRVHEPDGFGPVLDKLGRRKAAVRIDGAADPVWIAQRLERAGARVIRQPDLCQLPKACKNPVEQDGMRAAHLRDGAAVCRFLAWLDHQAPKGGVSELDAQARLEAFRVDTGELRDLSFDTISGAGPNGAIVHYKSSPATNRALRPGELYLVDSGGQYPDGTTDITRTVFIDGGKRPPSREMRDRFTRVLKGHIALARAVFPTGTTGTQLDLLARQALWRAGLDYDHGTGHGVGSFLSVHEGPQRISKAPGMTALEPGMVISNEPGYYKTGAFGIRIENLVLVVAGGRPKGGERDMLGFETLTLAPIDRRLIEANLLDTDEIAWLDAYHARVRRQLKGRVDVATRTWLKGATRPISA